MKTVRDDDGTRYVLLKRADEASLVRDPRTGAECYVGNDRLEPEPEESPLEAFALAAPAATRTVIENVHDTRTLGLLYWIDDEGPIDVRTLLAESTFCESDLGGRLTSLTMAGLLDEDSVDGERAYRTTDLATEALTELRSTSADQTSQ
ncbi:DUF7346 family protein [Halovivax limisalsi]|uniref:DUF7346 family protein n=1 Tax=Halovivax limisalsi TaxID=1453760 RepID=UPI001FFD960F|nr:hypothetical protein [Halovivax limisalsi]